MSYYRWLMIASIATALSACQEVENSGGPPAMPPMEVSTVTVVPKTIPVTFEFVGVVNGYHTMEIRSRVEGVIVKIGFTEGQLVTEGDTLYVIDQRPFLAALDNAKAELEGEEAHAWSASRALERLKPIFEKNAASRKDFDEALALDQTAKARVASAKAKVKQAELNLDYTTITTPITGLSGESNYGTGALISPGGKFLTKITTIDPVYVYFHVSESDVLKERREMQKHLLELPPDRNFDVQITLADGTIFPALGKLDFTAPTFRPETGTMMMRALFPNPEGILRPGQFVRAKLLGAQRFNAIEIPQRAVLQGSKGMFVYLVKNGKAVEQYIEPGEWNGNNWIITSGLNKGDVVIVDGVTKITPGSAVIAEPINEDKNPPQTQSIDK